MAGLLDFLNQGGGLLGEEEQRRAQQAGLMGLAQGLLGAGQPSRIPMGFGAALGQGLGGYAQAQGDAASSALKEKAMGQQFEQNAMTMDATKRKQAANTQLARAIAPTQVASADGQIGYSAPPMDAAAFLKDPRNFAALVDAGHDPLQLIQAMNKPDDGVILPENATYIDKRTGKTITQGSPKKTEFERQLDSLYPDPNDPRRVKIMEDYVKRHGEGAKTTINMPSDDGLSEYWKTLGKKLPDLESQARSAVRTNTSLAGMLAPGAIGASQFLESLGVKYQPEVLSNTREFDAQKNILVLDFMASMGGARGFSKEESAVLYDAFPKIIDSPEARSRIAKMLMNRNNLVIEDYNSTRDQFESATGKKLPSPRFAPGTAPSPVGNSGPTPEAARAELERRRQAPQ